LSKIFKKENPPENTRDYLLNDFTADVDTPKEIRDTLFSQEKFGSGAPDEFIAGGFDFAYEGGLRKEEILSKSLDEAEELLRNARAEVAAIEAKAEADGFEKGRKSGYETGLREIEPLVNTFRELIRELTEVRGKFYENSEEEMIHLVISVARTILGIEIQENPVLLRTVIRKAVLTLKARENINIRVNPEDMAEAEEFKPELRKDIQSSDNVTFRADPLITRGGCMVETNIGSIDARIETQLEAIRESFIKTMQESRAKEEGEANADA